FPLTAPEDLTILHSKAAAGTPGVDFCGQAALAVNAADADLLVDDRTKIDFFTAAVYKSQVHRLGVGSSADFSHIVVIRPNECQLQGIRIRKIEALTLTSP